MMIRHPVAAGTFYPAEEHELRAMLSTLMKSAEFGSAVGVISPHAGYVYSGAAAAKSLSHIKQSPVVILSPNHTGYGKDIAVSKATWRTPLGDVDVDQEMANYIVEKTSAEFDEEAHSGEHAIEVQLPFLQYHLKEFKIVPITIKHASKSDLNHLAEVLSDMNASFVASSDFTHYGPMYGFVPFIHNVRENLYKLDMSIIDYILKLDPDKFYEAATSSTVCGVLPIFVLLHIMKRRKARPKLIDYYTSGDVTSDFTNAVGYASIVFR